MNKMTSLERIGYLKAQIDEQREWGNNNVADMLAEELAAELAKIPKCWIGDEE